MMIGGQFNTPADWTRAGNAIKTIDDFAAAHHGKAPVLVFVDSGGAFNNDTECVNGVRGNAADHLTKDVVPYMVSSFGVSPDRSNWGVAGWSMGGTCAVDLTVMHPEMFSAFVDVAGDFFPNAGNKAQTISRLFGGNADAWAAFDPTTVINRHGQYHNVSGWFAISSDGPPAARRDVAIADTARCVSPSREAAANPSNQTAAAYSLCALGPGQRHRLRGAPPAGQARLAVRGPSLRGRAAVAGRPAGHSGGSAGSVARRVACRRVVDRPGGGPGAAFQHRYEVTASAVRCAGSACAVCAALQSVECVDTLGEHPVDPGAAMDAAVEPCGVARDVAGGQSVRLRQAGASASGPGRPGRCWARSCGSAVDPRDASHGGQRADIGGRAESPSSLPAAIDRVPAAAATAVQMALTLVYWEQMVRYLERERQDRATPQ